MPRASDQHISSSISSDTIGRHRYIIEEQASRILKAREEGIIIINQNAAARTTRSHNISRLPLTLCAICCYSCYVNGAARLFIEYPWRSVITHAINTTRCITRRCQALAYHHASTITITTHANMHHSTRISSYTPAQRHISTEG